MSVTYRYCYGCEQMREAEGSRRGDKRYFCPVCTGEVDDHAVVEATPSL